MGKTIHESRSIPIEYTEEQYNALVTIECFLKSSDLYFLLVGNAGTGKTTIAENIAKFGKALVLAPTNTAVNRLKNKFCDPIHFPDTRFKTIHAQLYGHPDLNGNFQMNRMRGLSSKTVYIIDEASMIDKELLDDLISESQKKKCKLIFIGDDFQLEPVGKDPKLFDANSIKNFFNNNYYKLNKVMRNDSNILKVANNLRLYDSPYILDINDEDFKRVKNFSDELGYQIENNNDYIVLVSTNAKRVEYNNYIRGYRFKDEAITPVLHNERVISVSNLVYTNGECYVLNKPIVKEIAKETILIKNYGKEIKKTYEFYLIEHEDANGNFRKTLLIPNLDLPSIHKEQLMQADYFKNNPVYSTFCMKEKRFKWNANINIATYAYAISVHKSQGNEWDYVYINSDWLSDSWNKSRWYYTAITRARKKVELKMSTQYQIK